MIVSGIKPSFRAVAIALGAAFLISLAIIVLLSDDPAQAAFFFFAGPFLKRYHFGNMLDNTALLTLTGLGVAIAFRGGTFNLGGEGQSYTGSLIAAITATTLARSFPGIVAIPVALLVAGVTGGMIASVSGVLRAKWGIDELITSFLLSSASIPFVDYLIGGPLRDPDGYLLATPMIPASMRFAHLLAPSTLNAGIVIAIIVVIAAHLAIKQTRIGYEFRMTGSSPRFAGYGGIRNGTYLIAGMALSGVLHGLAGGLYVVGTRYMATQGGTGGLGWNGIAVALIAENNPIAVIPAAIVFSYLGAATETAMLNTGFSFELSALVQAAVFLLITVKAFGRR